jgi:hypothetical protein
VKLITTVAIALVTAIAGHCDEASEENSVSAVKRSWQAILDAKPNKKEFSTDAEYWFPILDVAEKEAKTLFSKDHRAARIKFFVDQFGKHGGETDFRWVLTDLWCALPARGGFLPSNEQVSLEDRDRFLVFAEAHVRRLLADPKLLDRYYRFVVWSQVYFGKVGPHGDSLTPVRWSIVREQFQKHKEPPDYWWLARDVLLLAAATGQTDLLKDAKPEELRGVFEKIDAWIAENEKYLVADEKEPRWKVSKPARTLRIPRKSAWPVLAPPERPFDDWPKELSAPDATWLLKIKR